MTQENMLAPWAELVPDVGPMTVADLLALPDDSRWRYELVEGRLVRMSPTGGGHGNVALVLAAGLYNWVTPRHLGRVLAAETGFQVGPNTVLAGDFALVRAELAPAPTSATWERFWPVAPDLVGDVVSPSQTQDDVEAKARAWLGAGVRVVWVVWPKRERVDVWRHDAAGVPQREATLTRGDTLDGLDVLPGFKYPVSDLFA